MTESIDAALFAGSIESSRGRAAHKKGIRFEAELVTIHERYWMENRAAIYHLPVETAPAPKPVCEAAGRPFGTLRILAEAQHCDFIGGLCAPPFSLVAMEAKSSSDRLTSIRMIPDKRTGFGVKHHQLRGLGRFARHCNAISAIVWRNGGEVLVLGPAGVMEAESRLNSRAGLKSIPADAFDVADPRDWLTTAMLGWRPITPR